MDDATMPLEPVLIGRTLASYRLITEIGSGGMGKVFYAEHTVIGRRAAIKVLNPQVARDHTITSRFLNEAKAVNEIHHPNVVQITDIGHDGDLQFIVMEFLEGETLGERLERVRVLDEPTLLRVTRQVTAALGAAHQRNILHRDLKPDNIFLTNHPDIPDHVKVLDFGIAKLQGVQEGGAKLTKAGTVLGTPAYMAPEQCKGAEMDARGDIYSLAVLLYQAVAGTLPFAGDSSMEVMIAHVTTPPVPPIQHNPKLSPHINEAIMKALEKEPARRFATMAEFWAALESPGGTVAAEVPAEESAAQPGETPQQKGIRGVADKLTAIIDARIQGDRLVVPTMPAIAVECLKVIRDPRQTFKSVGEVIAKDAVLSSRVLKLANSAAFPNLSQAVTLEGAIARMGIEGLTGVLVTYSLHQAFTSRDERIRASFRGIWEHSLGVALLAKDLASKMVPAGPEPNVAYVAGLLHDVGKPVVASLLLEAEKQVNQGKKNAWLDESVWRKIVGASHRKVGVILAKKWKLPNEVIATIEDCKAYDRNNARSCANVVRLANALAKRAGLYVGDTSEAEIERTVELGQHIIGLGTETVTKIVGGITARVATMLDGSPAAKRR